MGEDGKMTNPLGRYREDPAVSEIGHDGLGKSDAQIEGMSAPCLCVTTVKDKERSAERELVEYLETVSRQICSLRRRVARGA
jgi:tRNA acetyltransferase TAN1